MEGVGFPFLTHGGGGKRRVGLGVANGWGGDWSLSSGGGGEKSGGWGLGYTMQ